MNFVAYAFVLKKRQQEHSLDTCKSLVGVSNFMSNVWLMSVTLGVWGTVLSSLNTLETCEIRLYGEYRQVRVVKDEQPFA